MRSSREPSTSLCRDTRDTGRKAAWSTRMAGRPRTAGRWTCRALLLLLHYLNKNIKINKFMPIFNKTYPSSIGARGGRNQPFFKRQEPDSKFDMVTGKKCDAVLGWRTGAKLDRKMAQLRKATSLANKLKPPSDKIVRILRVEIKMDMLAGAGPGFCDCRSGWCRERDGFFNFTCSV